ncbi:GNAT family N-acetyltransferase [Gordonia araii]|nr:GNAT family N-acetyltransferase [Gordonia araii]NNG96483.1 GNAT family N-acetyltransferase [Gordonia araii NBRC 100433]
MATDSALQFRAAGDDDWADMFAADSRAFGVTAPVDEEQRTNERARIANADTVIARDTELPGEPLVGQAMYYRLTMSVPGGNRIDFPGLTWVSVAPTHRRRGILRELLTRLRTKWDDEGHALAALWASEGTIYERFGFGPAIFAEDVRIDERLSLRAPAPARSQVRFATAEQFAQAAPAIYDRWADVHPGVMLRDALWWEDLFLDDRPTARPFTTGERQYLLHADGYATYRLDSAHMGADDLPDAHIEEVVAVTDEAHTELWRVLAALDLVATTTATLPVGDPLPFKVTDLRGVKVTSRYDTLWVAILDVEAALTARTYAADLDATLVVDDRVGDAGGRYHLRIVDGVAALTRGDGGTGEIACDITALGSLYFGGVDARTLAAAGRLSASSPELLTAFADVWRTAKHPATGIDF